MHVSYVLSATRKIHTHTHTIRMNMVYVWWTGCLRELTNPCSLIYAETLNWPFGITSFFRWKYVLFSWTNCECTNTICEQRRTTNIHSRLRIMQTNRMKMNKKKIQKKKNTKICKRKKSNIKVETMSFRRSCEALGPCVSLLCVFARRRWHRPLVRACVSANCVRVCVCVVSQSRFNMACEMRAYTEWIG